MATKYSNEQVAMFQKFLRSGYELDEVKNPRFDAKQLKELYLAKKEGIDISLYNSPDVPNDVMKSLRVLGIKGFDLEGLANTVIESGKYSNEQALQILDAAKHDVNIKNMLNPELDHRQMRQIKLGECYGVDTNVYASPDFTAEQMQMLRVELIIRKILDTLKEFFQETWEKFTNLIQRDTEQEIEEESSVFDETAESTVFDVLVKKIADRVYEQIKEEGDEFLNEKVFDIEDIAEKAAEDIDRYYYNFDKTIDESELAAEEKMIKNYEMERQGVL